MEHLHGGFGLCMDFAIPPASPFSSRKNNGCRPWEFSVISKLIFPACLLSILYLSGCSTSNWIKDPSTGCEVFNPRPVPGEYIKYEGDCLNGKANGYGTLTWFQDSCATSKATGKFISGKLEGKVTVEYYESSASRFEGNYVAGEREGFGTYFFSFGKTESGIYREDGSADSASITWKNGKRYCGQLDTRDEMSGQGSLAFPNGDVYTGAFLKNKRQGKGIYKWSNGDTYEGIYDSDSSAGPGFYSFSNGSTYDINAVPKTLLVQKEQVTLQRSGLIEEKTAKEFSITVGKRLPYPPSLLRSNAEMDASLRLLIGNDGKVKKYRFSIDRITIMKKSEHSAYGYEPDRLETISSIQEEEAERIVNIYLELSFPPACEEGETFDAWIKIPLHFRLREY
jgi:hypothetical protein